MTFYLFPKTAVQSRVVAFGSRQGYSAVKQRICRRYELQLPVLYSWTDETGAMHQAGGFTRNISTQGIYIVSTQLPPRGADLSLQATLPPLEEAANVIPLQASGRVLRIEGRGFALTSDFGLWGEAEFEPEARATGVVLAK